MITQIKVLRLIFLVVSIAAAGFSPQSLFAVQQIDQSVGLQVPRVLKVTEAGDCGQAINPLSVEGQVEGSIVMGMGQALYEEMVVKGDRVINPNLHEYRIPTMADISEMDNEIVESYDPNHLSEPKNPERVRFSR